MKELREDKLIRKILDKNYFHVSTTMKEDGSFSWKVFYANLDGEDYFSEENKPLLTSEKHTIEDIKKLADKFEEEKKQEKRKSFFFSCKIGYHSYLDMLKIEKIFNSIMTNILIILTLIVTWNWIFIKSIEVSSVIMVLTIFIGIMSVYGNKKMDKVLDNSQKEMQEITTQEYIKMQGLKFAERLRK